jgi:3-methyl-2-oxobutanoate hydroxymethyltransferase
MAVLSAKDIRAMKGKRKIVTLTAYTTPMAKMLRDHVDILLVGDSVGMVLYGMDNTLGVDIETMIRHGQAVMRGAGDAFVVVDMPYGTYEECPSLATENAHFLAEKTGCHAVKLEGGVDMVSKIVAIRQSGIEVMAHIGLQPQSVVAEGGYKIKGKTEDEVQRVLDDARAVAEAGAFAVVVEGTLPDLAAKVTEAINIPTIGIGASAACDGQVLVTEDMLGLSGGYVPKFVKQYAGLERVVNDAAAAYAGDVRSGAFPSEDQLYKKKAS